MAILPNYALKQLFENGDLLTQSSLYELIDATYNQTLVAGSNITLNTVTTPSGTTVTINGAAGGSTASNGLTESAGDIKLGGTLTAATSIALDTHDLSFTGIGNVDIGLTYATGTAKTFLETGKDVLGLTALGLPNGVDGFGMSYMEDPASFTTSNAAAVIGGNLSDFGLSGTGTAIYIRVADYADTLPISQIFLATDSVVGDAYVQLYAFGYNTAQSEVGLMAEHDADIVYSVASIAIGGPTGTKELEIADTGWGPINDVVFGGDQYTFPWTSGTAGQVLADDGLGNHDLTWVDMGGGLFEENTTGGAQSTQRVGAGTASGYYSTISGGYINTASGDYSTIGGGIYNTSSGPASTVGGGGGSTASGYYSTIGGGIYNIASDNISTVGGGYNNTASGYNSTISGGRTNIASDDRSTVGGGGNNTASAAYSTIGGGGNNSASGDYSSVLGGQNNNTSTFANSHIIGSNITSDRADTTFIENLSIKSIPLSAAGLPSGSVWSNGGVLNIV
jgi:hypothetical protein